MLLLARLYHCASRGCSPHAAMHLGCLRMYIEPLPQDTSSLRFQLATNLWPTGTVPFISASTEEWLRNLYPIISFRSSICRHQITFTSVTVAPLWPTRTARYHITGTLVVAPQLMGHQGSVARILPLRCSSDVLTSAPCFVLRCWGGGCCSAGVGASSFSSVTILSDTGLGVSAPPERDLLRIVRHSAGSDVLGQ